MIKMFGYLKKYLGARNMIFSNYPKRLDYPTPEHDNWKEFYPDAEEHIPNKAKIPEPKGSSVRFT